MDKLQVSVAYTLLMVFDTNLVQTAEGICQTCPPGLYVARNCSRNHDVAEATKCAPCTDCLANFLDTLAPCSTYKNTVCRSKNMPMVTEEPELTDVPPNVWILTGVFASMFLLVLLALFFKRMILISKANFSKLPSAETTIIEITDINHPETKLQASAA